MVNIIGLATKCLSNALVKGSEVPRVPSRRGTKVSREPSSGRAMDQAAWSKSPEMLTTGGWLRESHSAEFRFRLDGVAWGGVGWGGVVGGIIFVFV